MPIRPRVGARVRFEGWVTYGSVEEAVPDKSLWVGTVVKVKTDTKYLPYTVKRDFDGKFQSCDGSELSYV